MSGFKLTVRFSGVCYFCPLGGAQWPDQQGKIGVSFPPAGSHKDSFDDKPTLDNELLRRHVPFMAYDPRDLVPTSSVSFESAAVWYFGGYRVTFNTGEKEDANVQWCFDDKLEGEWDLGQGDVGDKTGDMVWLAPLTKVCGGDYYEFNYECFTIPQPKEPVVSAQVFLNGGCLKTVVDDGNDWVFGKRLAGKRLKRPLAYEVHWEVNVTDDYLEIGRQRLCDCSKEEVVQLAPHAGDKLEIDFLAFDITNPLRWEVDRESEVDHDFRWHFQVLTPEKQEKIRKRLKGTFKNHRLPIPRPIEPDSNTEPNVQGANCLPAR